MLDLKLMQKNPDAVRESLEKRNSKIDVGEFTVLDERRKALIGEVENLKAEKNKVGPEIAKRKKAGEDASDLLEQMGRVAARTRELDVELNEVQALQKDWMMSVPNIPHESVPLGKGEEDNPVIRTVGEVPALGFAPKEHWELGTALGGLDFERAGQAGGRTVFREFRLVRPAGARSGAAHAGHPDVVARGTPRSFRRTSSTARP